MKYNTFDAILDGWEAETDEDAIEYARDMVWSEVETKEQEIGYANHIADVDGVGVYYDYGADYFFFTDETGE